MNIYIENCRKKVITDAILLNANDTVGSNNLYERNKHFLCGGGDQLIGIARRAYLCSDNALANTC